MATGTITRFQLPLIATYVEGTIATGTNRGVITITPPSEKKYLCTLGVVPVSWGGTLWLSSYASTNTTVWTDANVTADRNVRVYYLCY